MNTQTVHRAVPRYPALDSSFDDWAEMGQKEVGGVVDIANKRWKGGYIQPLAFPDQRVYFIYPEEWDSGVTDGRIVGRAVVFDIPPQEVIPGGKVQAFNVRLA